MHRCWSPWSGFYAPEKYSKYLEAGLQFLTNTRSTETNYAAIEFEMLTVCWAISKCKLFLSGLQHFTIITDHNPSISILNNHCLDEIEKPRLQRLKKMACNFTAQLLKGSNSNALDTLSKHHVSDTGIFTSILFVCTLLHYFFY